ncbi:DUF2617 family protein [Pseudonocardia humida]|uniref:DUF2617 family protein n=1 Tax=Pseudonocardia humida TaxID=2800819 RepID=A0ABT1A4B7_9PSEU|nr:DUF2617 family protein [Pseudonocardia humida]MCO1657825.1 DUF2617 family protein [Pseudonocardia humida]
MTLRVLDIAPLDVAAEALGLLLDAPVPPALADLALRDDDGGELVLHVLGASHAVLATRPGHRMTEQVSCAAVAGGGEALPPRADRPGYTMTAVTARVAPEELAGTAARLGALAGDHGWLCAAFPGADPAVRTALTALRGAAVPGGWAWRTWHLYPGEAGGVIVRTRSRWTP